MIEEFYLGLRTDVSLLLASGHPHANRYTWSHLWSEAMLVRRRARGIAAREALGLFAAAAQVLSGGETLTMFLEGLDYDE